MKGDNALIYYEEEQNATEALTKLQNFPVTPTSKLIIEFVS
jgi:hypothetical protein